MMSKYKSLFSPDKEISAAQYITEMVCKNKAAANRTPLPTQFYKLPEWKNFYIAQITKAHLLLDQFHEAIIIKIVQQKNIYSLRAKWIIKEFEKETAKTLDLAKSIENIQYERNTTSIGKIKKDLDLEYLDE